MTQGATIAGNELSRTDELLISIVVDILGYASTVVLAATLGTTFLVDLLMAVFTVGWILAMFFADGEDPGDFLIGGGLSVSALLENYIFIDLLPIATVSWAVKWSGFSLSDTKSKIQNSNNR